MYREFNDYEILYLISENHDDIFDILYKKYYPLIKKYTNRYKKSFKHFGYEEEDLLQIASIALTKASKYYNQYSESMFYTFLLTLLDNEFNLEYNKCNSNKHKSLNTSISYNNLIPGTNYTYIDNIGSNDLYEIEKENYEKIINIRNNLPFDIANILELKYNGYSNVEILKLLDISLEELRKNLGIIKQMYLDI